MTLAPTYSWFLALRYLLARWVNVLGIAGVAVAVWALIVVIAVFSGFIAEIREHIRGATADLVLADVNERCSYEAVRQVLERDPDVVATAPRLQHYAVLFPRGFGAQKPIVYTGAMGGSPLRYNFVNLIGVDPQREARTTSFGEWLRLEGEDGAAYAVADPSRPLAVSEGLYRRAQALAGRPLPQGELLSTGDGLLLGLRRMERGEPMEPGEVVDVVTARPARTQSGDETVKKIRRQCVITGGYSTRYRTFDESNAFVDIDWLRELLGQGRLVRGSVDLVSEVAIRVRPGADLQVVRHRLDQAVHGIAGGAVQTWEEQNAIFLGAVDHERGMMKLVLFCVMLVAAFLIYATLHMMVTQKVKDIGILTSLGAVPGGIAAIFLLCGIVVAAVGGATGVVLGVLSARYLNDVNDWFRARLGLELFPTDLYDLQSIPYRLDADWIATVVLTAFALALLVAFLPARRAARLDPVKALAYE